MIPNFWWSLEVAAAELHLCFVIKGYVWWRRTFLPMVTIVVLHHKRMKLFKPFTPHVIAWSIRNGLKSVDSCNERAANEIAVFGLPQWCRRRGCRGCKGNPKSFDLSKILTKSQWIRAQKFRHSATILLKWLLGFACIKVFLLCNIKGSGYRSVTSHAFRIKCWVCHFNGIFMVM